MSEHGSWFFFFFFSSDRFHYQQHLTASVSIAASHCISVSIFFLLFFGASFFILFALGSQTLGWHSGFVVLFYCSVLMFCLNLMVR